MIEVFKNSDMLSPNINANLSSAMHNDRSLYLTSRMSANAILDANNSETYIEVSTDFLRLDIHLIGVLFNMTRIHVMDLLVTRSCAQSASK
jgi:hypothetical protein